MKFISISFGFLILLLFLGISTNAQNSWIGEYHFNEDGGETVGGTKIYIAHTLKITEEGSSLKAHIYSQSFQTSKDIYADVKTKGNKIMLFFREKGEDHFLGDYKKGDLLFTLEKKDIDGKLKVLTYWGKFLPSLEANEKSGGIYFRKVGVLIYNPQKIDNK